MNSVDNDYWYNDIISSLTRQRNICIGFGLILLIVLGISLFSLVSLTDSQRLEPFVIEIAKDSGRVSIVDQATLKEYSANKAVSEYFLVKYIRARELFNPNTYKYDYYSQVRILSSQDVYDTFRYSIRLSNQHSPLNLYSNIVDSTMKIRSIHHINDNSVQIRFGLEFRFSDGRSKYVDKIAIISYGYLPIEMNELQRYINPLGFIIKSYKSEDEFL